MSVQTAHTIRETRQFIDAARASGKSIGVVPTMGALHAGHARLIETARRECDYVVVTIFVNPLQFGPNEDFSRYPRAMSSDLSICESNGAELVFAPSVGEMYPEEPMTSIELTKVTDELCGRFRPGHFRGVATVVLKLLNIVNPDRAFFGEKDLQQLAVVRRMVRDLNLCVNIVGVPTVRESDGLALSSRNQYLQPDERRAAPVIYRALIRARELAQHGERDAKRIRESALEIIGTEPRARIQYFDLVDENMQMVSTFAGPTFAATAVFFGTTRLIDNIRCL
jgi:pantoate--beta-alanine ligase